MLIGIHGRLDAPPWCDQDRRALAPRRAFCGSAPDTSFYVRFSQYWPSFHLLHAGNGQQHRKRALDSATAVSLPRFHLLMWSSIVTSRDHQITQNI